MSQSLVLLTTVALKGVLERIAPEFAKSTGFTFAPSWGPGGTIVNWMREGRSADVVVVTPDLFEDLVREGHCAAGPGIQLQAPSLRLDSGFARFRSRPGMTAFI